MHTHSIPFTIDSKPTERRIVLSGDLDGSREVYQKCERAVKDAVLHGLHWTIDASKARLPRGGVESWIAIVREYMVKCHLDYLPSQLATNLEYDDEYTHPNSSFLETGSGDDCEAGRCLTAPAGPSTRAP